MQILKNDTWSWPLGYTHTWTYVYVCTPPTYTLHKHTIENLWRVAILSHTYEQTSLSYNGHSASRANRTSKLLVCLLVTLHRPSKDHYVRNWKSRAKVQKWHAEPFSRARDIKFNSALCASLPALNVISSVLNPGVVTVFLATVPQRKLDCLLFTVPSCILITQTFHSFLL